MLNKNLINMDTNIYKDFNKELELLFDDYKEKLQNIKKQRSILNDKLIMDTNNFNKEDEKMLKLLKQEYNNIFVSDYATRDNLSDEFMAECFAEAKLSKNPSKTSLEVTKLIDKYFKKVGKNND